MPSQTISKLAEVFAHSSKRRSRAGVRHTMRLPEVTEAANGWALLEIAREILGRTAVPFRATLFDKSAKTNWLVTWHQDTALPLESKKEIAEWGPWSVKDGIWYAHAPVNALERVAALRVHLDDSKASNGPLRVLAGTHRAGVLTDEKIHKLKDEIPAVDCLVAAGGVLVMRPLVVHASSKSQGEERRRVLHIEYAESLTIADGFQLAIA